MGNRLNGISNATCRSPSLNGPNLDFDSGVPSYQMLPLRTAPSGAERLHDISTMKRIKSKNSQIWKAGSSTRSRDLLSFLFNLNGLLNLLSVCDW